MDGIQDRREAMACTQPPSREVNTVGGEMVGGGHEDCLFLDLTIPRKVFENPQKKVPVLVWIHGGYYSNSPVYYFTMLLLIPFSSGIEG